MNKFILFLALSIIAVPLYSRNITKPFAPANHQVLKNTYSK